MKKYYTMLLLGLLASAIIAQEAPPKEAGKNSTAIAESNKHQQEINTKQNGLSSKTSPADANWKTFDKTYPENPDELFSERKAEFGLSDKDEMMVKSQSTDELAIEHIRYQQYYEGIPVEGGEYIIHSSSDKLWGNGRLVHGIEASSSPSLSEEEALQKALAYIGADKYFWEDPFMEALIKEVKNDPEATFFPIGELVFADKKHSQDGSNYQLLWKFEINAYGDKMREFVYIDATNGELAYAVDLINYYGESAPEQEEAPVLPGAANGFKYNPSEGTAITRYYGEQPIIADSVVPDTYHLVDNTRGGGIETKNLEGGMNFGAAVHFVDDDNYWDNANPAMDDAATDAHFGMEMTYDFYLEKLNLNSFDGNGAKMVSLLHLQFNPNNGVGGAFFSGVFAAYGDGYYINNPQVSIDIVGHEFSHGVLYYTSSLNGTDEAGALSEGFCDIMGTAIEFYGIPDLANWTMGVENFERCDLSDPNASTTPFGDPYPDTYQGYAWATGEDDNGGVHTNGAVLGYWYYLLSEGGNGTNDNGDDYSVEGLGMDKATDIIYRDFTVYVTSSSHFIDARQGSIQAAIDLYGECSNEVQQVINAWYAVGVGPHSYTRDLALTRVISPVNNCDLSADGFVEVEVLYNLSGCGEAIPAGSSIGMSFQLDNDDPVVETWILDQDLAEGESLTYTFSEGISLPSIAVEYELSIYIDYASDELIMNNLIDGYKVERKDNYDGNTMGFENNISTNLNTFYTSEGQHAIATVDTVARNTGDMGFLLSSTSGFPSPFPDYPALNFEEQEDRISKICFCVDATEWSDVSLYFDMKQTHSKFFMNWWGSDSTEFASSMRMLINGEQFGEQYHPDTYFDDPFITYHFSLDEYAGTFFEFCFESKNYIDDDPSNPLHPYDSKGDNTYLDNVLFVDEIFTDVKENKESDFSIYPNPANDEVSIISSQGSEITEVMIFNQVGQQVLHQNQPSNTLDISMLEHGIYIIEFVSKKSVIREKLIVR